MVILAADGKRGGGVSADKAMLGAVPYIYAGFLAFSEVVMRPSVKSCRVEQ